MNWVQPSNLTRGGPKILLDLQGLQSKSRERGIGRLTRQLSHAIIAQAERHDIHVLLSEDLQETFTDLHKEFSDLLPQNHIHSFGPFGVAAELKPESRWRARAGALVREAKIAQLRPDLVHVGSLFEGFVDGAVTSIGRLNTSHAHAVTLYDLIPLADPTRYLADPVYRDYYYRHAQDLKRADLLLAISEHSKREGIERLQIPEERIAVIYAGVEERFRPTTISEKTRARIRKLTGTTGRFLLYVGAADPRKNIKLIFEAFVLLPQDMRATLSVVCAGGLSEDEKLYVTKCAREAGMPSDKVKLLGLVDDEELIALYTMCAALVFPSTSEGFGLPPLEAMACGTPTLVANATSLPEVVDRLDCQFDPSRADVLADRLVAILSDEGFREDLRRWGPARAAKFTWAASGRAALDAFDACLGRLPEAKRSHPAAPRIRRRPRMAFVSPLPPDTSGIADYSAELLRELLVYYDIDCIKPDPVTSDEWVKANCTLRDPAWFSAHAEAYDVVLYSIGNSTFHDYMFGLLALHPGVVIMHDAYLSDLAVYQLRGTGKATEGFAREVYRTHGLTGLRRMVEDGMDAVIADLTMSGPVYRNAHGVIVHSRFAAEIAMRVFGPDIERTIAIVPHLRGLPLCGDRAATRASLDLDRGDFVICAFGSLHPRKMNKELLEAFLGSAMAGDRRCCLVFVGGALPAYGAELDGLIAAAAPLARIRFTGRADAATYESYLQACDVAVQLRSESRGETSGATLDAMAHGLPVIVREDGAFAEIERDAVIKMSTDFTVDDLRRQLVTLRDDPDRVRTLGRRARSEIQRRYHPATVGRQIRDLIERFTAGSARSEERTLLHAVSTMRSDAEPSPADQEWLAVQIGNLLPVPAPRQILFDVTAIAQTDLRTGIERVTRAILERLITNPPAGFRIEPTLMEGETVVYARSFVEERLGLPIGGLKAAPVQTAPGDHFLVVDWAPDRLLALESWLGFFRRNGGIVTYVVHDLLPLEFPQYFPSWLPDLCERWLDLMIRSADNIACVSRSVAGTVARLGVDSLEARPTPLSLGYFHNGYDLDKSQPSTGYPADAEVVLARLRSRTTFLVLGTVEPRKGHAQAVAAFDELWRDGVDVGLAVVGKEGWMVGELAARMRARDEFGDRLVWLSGVSDEYLEKIFASCSALIACSMGEGFGLPLVEAAAHDLPVVARDIPVFREVAGEGAFFFEGTSAGDLASAIRSWLRLREKGQVPASSRIRRSTWAQATDELIEIMMGRRRLELLGPGQDPIAVRGSTK